VEEQGKASDQPLEADRIEAFRATIAPDQYAVAEFVPWESIEWDIGQHEAAIELLQHLVDGGQLTPDGLAQALEQEPHAVGVLSHLFVTASSVGFRDGRDLPNHGPLTARQARAAATLAFDLGIQRLLPKGVQIVNLFRIGAIALDSRRRAYRRRDDLGEFVEELIEKALVDARAATDANLIRLPHLEHPAILRGKVDEVIATDDQVIAAIATVFQGSTGGRQQRDLTFTYPRLQEDLDALPAALILIADGRGLAETPRRVLGVLLDSVAACMTFEGARSGELASALARAAVSGGARGARHQALGALITSALERQASVSARDLPTSTDAARLALSEYRAMYPEKALQLSSDGMQLAWQDRPHVAIAQQLRDSFEPTIAMKLLADVLGLSSIRPLEVGEIGSALIVGDAVPDPVLPDRVVIAGTRQPIDDALRQSIARLARMHVSGASIAFLLTSDQSYRREDFSPQRAHATSIVVADPQDLFEIATAEAPRDAIVQLVLRQADLTKANPFNSTGVTRAEMFFGRQVEEADLISVLASNSAALIGGRRIGKTSLLQSVIGTLERAGDWSPFYADLQEVGNWRTFSEHITLRWGVELPNRFSPAAITRLVRDLATRRPGRLVIALDEVDNLLTWDQNHGTTHVHEAFFRACRALSQEGAAQFVFSGERVIAQRLWDPSSPHWNFCRPVPVKQLDRKAADALLAFPLRAMGVQLEEYSNIVEMAWERSHGHPHIVQFLGERIVRSLNERSPEARGTVETTLVADILDSVDFARHYVTTYWGQAQPLERLVTALISAGHMTFESLRDAMAGWNLDVAADSIDAALRMIDLYGIVSSLEEPLELRAAWLPAALNAFGGVNAVVNDWAERVALEPPVLSPS
jgi:hypothetical protein